MAVFLGFDFGLRRIGVAVGQKITGTATPLTILLARDGQPDWDQVLKVIGEWKPKALIVGLPLLPDGSFGTMAFSARRFAGRLKARSGLPVHLVDERLTTKTARQQLRDQDQARLARGRVDSVAAQLILQDWLKDQKEEK